MDPPEGKSQTAQAKDESLSDLPMPLRDDLDPIYEVPQLPGSDETKMYESSFSALRIRLPSDCLPGRPDRPPPPVPCRTRVPRGNINNLFPCDIPGPAYKLDRSRTEVQNHVSM